jgi:hypothetical protein
MSKGAWWADLESGSDDDAPAQPAQPVAPVYEPQAVINKVSKEPVLFYYGSLYGNVVHAISGRTMPEKASSKESLKYYCVVMNEGSALGNGNVMKDPVKCYFNSPEEYEKATQTELSKAQKEKWRDSRIRA